MTSWQKYTVIIVPAIIVLFVLFWAWQQEILPLPRGGMVACTEEAKQCPDGSYVGRMGPKCEFAPCPSEALCEGGKCPGEGGMQRKSMDTSDWKTYQNEKYGFEMKYPSGWTHGYDNPDAQDKDDFTRIRLETDSARSISIQVIARKVVSGSKNYKILEVNGVQVIKILDPSGGFSIFHEKPDFEIYINDTSKVAEYGSYLPVDQNMIEQIVSTFTFTN